ncbi:MICOS complex subunit [Dirofilaria immitis]
MSLGTSQKEKVGLKEWMKKQKKKLEGTVESRETEINCRNGRIKNEKRVQKKSWLGFAHLFVYSASALEHEL